MNNLKDGDKSEKMGDIRSNGYLHHKHKNIRYSEQSSSTPHDNNSAKVIGVS
jgi:hypothetical protein